jgi:RND family efflux transporter MFP subunit
MAQKEAQRENLRARLAEIDARGRVLQEQYNACDVYARRPGMVVYEQYLNATPRRKIRVGDRVTASQVVVTIPEVSRMLVHASASEADVHKLAAGQAATVRLEAYPALRLSGKVTQIGTLARSDDRPADDKRFDVTVELDHTADELRPEMTARVDVVTARRADALLVPVNAVFDRDGQSVSLVVTDGGVEARPVRLGPASEDIVEIITGLSEGDRVALVDSGTSTAPPSGRLATPALAPNADAPVKVPNAGKLSSPR